MNLPDETTSFDDFAELLQTERAPRPLFILAAAKVDVLLADILSMYFFPKAASGKKEDELLFGDSPLSTFSSRIKICFRLGIIDLSLYKALDKLRSIRNLCAHNISVNCNISPMREHVTELRRMLKDRQTFSLTRERYFGAEQLSSIEDLQCLSLTICVILEAVKAATKQCDGQPHTMKIASR